MRHVLGAWNATWSDMFIETTFMRNGHGKKGIIGIILKPETIKVLSRSLHVCSQIEKDLNDLKSSEITTDCKHNEEFESRISADEKDKESIRRKLEQCIDPLDSSEHPESVINIVTRAIGMKSVNVDSAVEIGKEQMDEYESNWPANFYHPIKRKVVTLVAIKKHNAVDKLN